MCEKIRILINALHAILVEQLTAQDIVMRTGELGS
jgi:hypothetical protein